MNTDAQRTGHASWRQNKIPQSFFNRIIFKYRSHPYKNAIALGLARYYPLTSMKN